MFVGPFLRRSERSSDSETKFTNVFVKNLDEGARGSSCAPGGPPAGLAAALLPCSCLLHCLACTKMSNCLACTSIGKRGAAG